MLTTAFCYGSIAGRVTVLVFGETSIFRNRGVDLNHVVNWHIHSSTIMCRKLIIVAILLLGGSMLTGGTEHLGHELAARNDNKKTFDVHRVKGLKEGVGARGMMASKLSKAPSVSKTSKTSRAQKNSKVPSGSKTPKTSKAKKGSKAPKGSKAAKSLKLPIRRHPLKRNLKGGMGRMQSKQSKVPSASKASKVPSASKAPKTSNVPKGSKAKGSKLPARRRRLTRNLKGGDHN